MTLECINLLPYFPIKLIYLFKTEGNFLLYVDSKLSIYLGVPITLNNSEYLIIYQIENSVWEKYIEGSNNDTSPHSIASKFFLIQLGSTTEYVKNLLVFDNFSELSKIIKATNAIINTNANLFKTDLIQAHDLICNSTLLINAEKRYYNLDMVAFCVKKLNYTNQVFQQIFKSKSYKHMNIYEFKYDRGLKSNVVYVNCQIEANIDNSISSFVEIHFIYKVKLFPDNPSDNESFKNEFAEIHYKELIKAYNEIFQEKIYAAPTQFLIPFVDFKSSLLSVDEYQDKIDPKERVSSLLS